MKFPTRHAASLKPAVSGFTMVEMVVAAGVGSLLLLVVTMLFINASRSFVAMGNYQDLDAKSTTTLDTFSKDIRNATAVVSSTTNVLTLTNATAGTRTILTYSAAARNLTMTVQTNGVTAYTKTNLTECDSWSFKLYSRIPNFSGNNVTFSVTNVNACKLINMTWKCSRTVIGAKITTESVQTAQVVLRNKVK